MANELFAAEKKYYDAFIKLSIALFLFVTACNIIGSCIAGQN